MHGDRIYRAQLPDAVVFQLMKNHLTGDLKHHIWDGEDYGDPGWVYLDYVALNRLVQDDVIVMHVSAFLFLNGNCYILNPMVPASV
jgi:hypothetical protein